MADVKSSRREKAAATRKAILRAAQAEFVEQGFAGATIAGIAARAGVATQTVYFVFHTKAALISAAIDLAVMGEEELPPQAQPWWQAMVEEPDATVALRTFVRGASPVFARASALAEVLRAAALTDAEVRRTHEYHENLRRIGFGQVLDLLAEKAPLRADGSREQLLDTFLVVFGDAVYHLYTAAFGWSDEDVVTWLCDVLPPMLLAAAPRT